MAGRGWSAGQVHHIEQQAAAARENAETVLTLMRATVNDGTVWPDDELVVACAGRLRASLQGSAQVRADALAYVVADLAMRIIRAEQGPGAWRERAR